MQKVINSWKIPSDVQGVRADQYLKRKIGRISREKAQKIILSQGFLLNSSPIKPSTRVKWGQKASLLRTAPDKKTDINSFKLEIIFENNNFLVVNKPCFLNIHPTANCLYKTLTFWLRKNYPHKKINPCHRLDKETSGLVICAKNKATDSAVKKLFTNRKVNKTYIAIVRGHFSGAKIINISLGLQKDRGLVAMKMVEDKGGKPAITHVRAIKYDKISDRTLVIVKPKTGRQHQIRAHLAIVGFPIVGDKLYNAGDANFLSYCNDREIDIAKISGHKRHALHALRLKFKYNDDFVKLSAPWPDDFFDLGNWS